MTELAIFNLEEIRQAKKLGNVKFNKETKTYTCDEGDYELIDLFGKVYLDNCKFLDNEELKKKGAHWDGKLKKWYIKKSMIEMFNKYIDKSEKIYLNVPYALKDDLKKQFNLKFDGIAKKWFIKSDRMCEDLEDLLF